MGSCFFVLALICFGIGIFQLLTPGAPEAQPASGFRAQQPPVFPREHTAPGSSTDLRTVLSQATSRSPASGPQKLGWIKPGQRIYTLHPVRGKLMSHVLGKVTFTELWQTVRGPQSPWVPTGSSFAGFTLEGGLFLLNWQNRFYLLDESTPVSDAEIQRDFAQHARQFAASDQTADVYFAYPPAMWHIDDIGKFRIEQVDGDPHSFRPSATGRFIHASGDSQRALVLEDYEGGGGQDMVWTGYLLNEEDISEA